ncbi:hypothetical protein [Streptomyces sp. NPDC005435]|uniref:hypothetical protein n=1 Tax=Streptomyces sp. NPDC005435 TaxID=3154464 RepID=UPI003456439C
MTSKLRIAAATVTAALALGVAAPMADAAEAARTPAVATVATVPAPAALTSAQADALTAALVAARTDAVTTRAASGDLNDVAQYITAYIKKYLAKEYAKAKAAAKKGYTAFVKWVKSLKPDNPVRLVLEFGGKPLIQIVITLLKK